LLANLLPPLVPLFFVAVLAILLRQSRGDDRIRWWICAWLCQAFSHLALLWAGLTHPTPALFLSIIGGMACNICNMLSAPAQRKDTRQIYLVGFGICLPAFSFAAFTFFGNGSRWPLYLILAVGLCCGGAAVTRRFRQQPKTLGIIVAVCALTCIPVALAISHRDFLGALSLVFVQIVLGNVLMFARNYPARSAGLWVTLFGLVLWIVSSPAALHYFHDVFFQGGTVAGERFVGIGMIMILVEESLLRAHTLSRELEAIFEQSPHMMWVVDQQTFALTRANQAAADAHGYSLEEFRRLRLHDIMQPKLTPRATDGTRQGPESTPNSLHIRKDGILFPVDIQARDILVGDSPQRLIMGIDVTEREALVQKLAYEAAHDQMTGLYSRQGLIDLEDGLLEQSARKGKGVAFVAICLRYFKAINETYGDHVGDHCLRVIGRRIQDHLRPCDIAARTSGSSFKVLFSDVDGTADAERLANNLLAALGEPVVMEKLSIRVRVDVGFAASPDDANDATKLRAMAQTAMTEVGKLGLNHAFHFLPDQTAAEARDHRIIAAMEEMLDARTFEMHYQPVCRVDGVIEGLEALLRMNHPELGPISPAIFIPIAEETGLIVPLGQWILEHVCTQIREWRQRGLPLVPVAINISGLQFRQSNFSSMILKTLASFDIPSYLLHLEMTESTVLQNISDALEEMQKLSANGLRFSIDDFGTGYSSLGRLQEMPITTLKIDRSFVRGTTSGTSLMLAAIISLAHALGMKVIAEGVEQDEELSVLRNLKCDLIQGYIFSKPLHPRELEPLLLAGTWAASPSLSAKRAQKELRLV
jgi:diguanylate cyclase (GGDEF)-like protein/PAS domain S-box-containing protein